MSGPSALEQDTGVILNKIHIYYFKKLSFMLLLCLPASNTFFLLLHVLFVLFIWTFLECTLLL